MLNSLHYLNRLRQSFGIADAIRAFINLRITKTGIIKVPFLKYPFRIRLNNHIDRATFHEVILRKEYFLELKFHPKTIIDGGANIGLTAVYFANEYPDAKIVSVEPDTDNYNLLKENAAPYPNITPVQSAIWSKKTWLKLVDTGRGANSFTVEECTEQPGAFYATSIIEIMKQQNWDVIDLLKLDIEGSEKEIFTNGYEEWLPKTRVVVVETHDRHLKGSSRAVFTAVSKYNFSCRVQGLNLVFYNDDLGYRTFE